MPTSQFSNTKDKDNKDNTFTTKDIPPPPTDNIHLSKKQIEEAEEQKDADFKHNNSNKKKDDDDDGDNKLTIIPVSCSRQEYEKAGVAFAGSTRNVDEARERHHRLTKGKWTRKVTKITWIRTIDDEEYLDWSEIRTGKTDMKRVEEKTFDNVSRYEIPTAAQKVEFDPENEEYKTITSDKPQSTSYAYAVKFSKKALDELIADAVPYQTEYLIMQQNGRVYTTSKKEMEKNAGSFDKLYNLKSGNTQEEK